MPLNYSKLYCFNKEYNKKFMGLSVVVELDNLGGRSQFDFQVNSLLIFKNN